MNLIAALVSTAVTELVSSLLSEIVIFLLALLENEFQLLVYTNLCSSFLQI